MRIKHWNEYYAHSGTPYLNWCSWLFRSYNVSGSVSSSSTPWKWPPSILDPQDDEMTTINFGSPRSSWGSKIYGGHFHGVGLAFVVPPLRHFKYQTAIKTAMTSITSTNTNTINAVFQKLFSGHWVSGEVDTVMVVVLPLAQSGSSNCRWSDRSPWCVSPHWSLSLDLKS